MFQGNHAHFEEGSRPIEHSCKKEKEKLECRTLIKTNIQGKPKYTDKKSYKYQDIESFWNRMSLLEFEIQKRKGNIITPREDRRAIKVRITNKSYQKKQWGGREKKGRTQREAKGRRGGYRSRTSPWHQPYVWWQE